LNILFLQVSDRLVTGSCEYHLDLASECRRFTAVADYDAIDRSGLLWSTRHCPIPKFCCSIHDTIRDLKNLPGGSRNPHILRSEQHNGQPRDRADSLWRDDAKLGKVSRSTLISFSTISTLSWRQTLIMTTLALCIDTIRREQCFARS
jgi:hypothetical protein